MKDIEKLFQEKLKNHQVVPPAKTWEKLNTRLHQKRKKLTLFYWKIAASILVFIGGVGVAYIHLNGPNTPLPRVGSNHLTQHSLPEMKVDEVPATESKPSEESKNFYMEPKQTAVETEKDSSDPIKEKKLPSSTKANQSQKENADTKVFSKPHDLTEVPTIQPNTIRPLAIKEYLEDPVLPQVTLISRAEGNSPIKIIYKGAKPQEKHTSLEKTFAFIDHLKSANISFSELRKAKDEWITKTFSAKNDEEMGR